MDKDERIYLKGPSKLMLPVVEGLLSLNQMLRDKDLGTVYGEPSYVWQSIRECKPQVQLHFKEEIPLDRPNRRRLTANITFRLMQQESETISKAEATTIATKTKALFMADNGLVWDRGKRMCTYTDWERGYQLQLLCDTEAQGKQLVMKVLAIQGHAPEWKRFNVNENSDPGAAYPETPLNKVILGETEQMPRRRPNAKLRFQYAVLHVYGRKDPVPLCDRSNKLVNPLV